MTVNGKTLANESATREIWFAGAGAFVILKALALRSRGENKDAYDLLYVLRHFGPTTLVEVVKAIRPLLAEAVTTEALAHLEADFKDDEHIGPIRAAAFEGRQTDRALRQDHVALVAEFLRRVRQAEE